RSRCARFLPGVGSVTYRNPIRTPDASSIIANDVVAPDRTLLPVCSAHHADSAATSVVSMVTTSTDIVTPVPPPRCGPAPVAGLLGPRTVAGPSDTTAGASGVGTHLRRLRPATGPRLRHLPVKRARSTDAGPSGSGRT